MAVGLALALWVVAASEDREAWARASGHAGPGGDFGLGLVLGTPTGLSAEYFADRANSLHFALGVDFLEEQDFHLHLNWRGYLAAVGDGADVRFPIYVGLGGFVRDRDFEVLGLRAPVGFSIDFRRAPMQLFFELGLHLQLTGDGAPTVDYGGALGLHRYF